MARLNYKTTKDLNIPKLMVDQVIGQEHAVNIIKKAAFKRRNVLLIGSPGTGKSLIGVALAELLPQEKLVDVVSFANPSDENVPLIKKYGKGKGKALVTQAKIQAMGSFRNQNILLFVFVIIASILPYYFYSKGIFPFDSAIVYAASMITSIVFIVGFMLFLNLSKRTAKMGGQGTVPKLLIDNSTVKKSPFHDATGAHAGALLGDVLHDPLQCLSGNNKIKTVRGTNIQNRQVNEVIDQLLDKNKEFLVSRKDRNYQALFLNPGQLFILGSENGFIKPVEVLSCNRHDTNKGLIRITTQSGKEIITTPEHKIPHIKDDILIYQEAKDITKEAILYTEDSTIILDEQDIINTYSKRQQEQCRLYYQYKKVSAKNPSWGYKRIAKSMGQPIGKTRWWHAKKHIPIPIQTVHWLKERNLLPLRKDHYKIGIIAKVLGATYGDGGIFENKNGIFLSSSEIEATQEFGIDLSKIFGPDIHSNKRTIEGGIEGHSWCYQNTNRNVIRFFLALGTPMGKKTKLEFQTPTWVLNAKEATDEFYSSFLGSELGVPKVHKHGNRLDMLSLGITGTTKTITSKINLLRELGSYLEGKGVKCTSLRQDKGKTEGTILARLLISTQYGNVLQFMKNTKLNYCKYKSEKIIQTMKQFQLVKKNKFNELVARGYGAEQAMSLLKITPQSYYHIMNEEEVIVA